MQPNPIYRMKAALEEGGFPLTKLIIAVNLLTLTLVTFKVTALLNLAYFAPLPLKDAWTILTYPFLSTSIIGLLQVGCFVYWAGGSLERSWGSAYFARFFVCVTIVSALGVTMGSYALREPIMAYNWLPTAALVMAYCAVNQFDSISFFLAGSIPTRIVAIITAMVVFFIYAQAAHTPIMGFFALLGCLLTYAFVRNRNWDRVGHYATAPVIPLQAKLKPKPRRGSRDDAFTWRSLNPFEWIARWRRKRQFMRLWKDD